MSVAFFSSVVAVVQSIWLPMSMSFRFPTGSFPACNLGHNSSDSDRSKSFRSAHRLLRPTCAALNKVYPADVLCFEPPVSFLFPSLAKVSNLRMDKMVVPALVRVLIAVVLYIGFS